MQKYKIYAILSTFLPLLSSCSSTPTGSDIICPNIKIEKATAKSAYFRGNNTTNPLDEIFSAEILGYQGYCSYDKDKPSVVNLNLSVTFDAELGPATQSLTQQASYFVAIPEFYPSSSAKQVFPITVTFPQGHDHIEYRDHEIVVSIPISKNKKASDYTVYIGMQIDKQQLEYNRSNRTVKDLK